MVVCFCLLVRILFGTLVKREGCVVGLGRGIYGCRLGGRDGFILMLRIVHGACDGVGQRTWGSMMGEYGA